MEPFQIGTKKKTVFILGRKFSNKISMQDIRQNLIPTGDLFHEIPKKPFTLLEHKSLKPRVWVLDGRLAYVLARFKEELERYAEVVGSGLIGF